MAVFFLNKAVMTLVAALLSQAVPKVLPRMTVGTVNFTLTSLLLLIAFPVGQKTITEI